MSKPLEYITKIREGRELTVAAHVEQCRIRLSQQEEWDTYPFRWPRQEIALFEALRNKPIRV